MWGYTRSWRWHSSLGSNPHGKFELEKLISDIQHFGFKFSIFWWDSYSCHSFLGIDKSWFVSCSMSFHLCPLFGETLRQKKTYDVSDNLRNVVHNGQIHIYSHLGRLWFWERYIRLAWFLELQLYTKDPRIFIHSCMNSSHSNGL